MNWKVTAISAAVCGLAVHLACLFLSPALATDYQIREGLKRGGGWNQLIFNAPPRAGRTKVPLANADTLGTRAYLNLAEGPLMLEGPVPKSCVYWSASVFAHNTDTALIASDRDFPSGRFRIAIHTKGQNAPPADKSAVLPSRKGVLLLRCFMRDREDQAYLKTLDAERRRITLTLVKRAAA